MTRLFSFLVLVQLAASALISCDSPEKTADTKNDSVSAGATEKDTARTAPASSPGLSEFSNIEMSEFCILLPQDEYREVFEKDQEKGYHAFEPKTRSSDQPHLSHLGEFRHIDVQTFIIDEKFYRNAMPFYEADRADTEENNLVIDTSYSTGGFYFIRGHLPNYSDLYFARLAWVRDDKVVLNAVFHQNDAGKWNTWLKEIIARGVDCKH